MYTLLLSSTKLVNPQIIDPIKNLSAVDYVNRIIPILITTGFIICVVAFFLLFVIGGIQWIISGSDKQKLENAKSKIVNAITGLIILLLLWFILQLINTVFHINIGNLGYLKVNKGSIAPTPGAISCLGASSLSDCGQSPCGATERLKEVTYGPQPECCNTKGFCDSQTCIVDPSCSTGGGSCDCDLGSVMTDNCNHPSYKAVCNGQFSCSCVLATSPSLTGYSGCDFNGNGIFESTEVSNLTYCIFHNSEPGCSRDPNSDGKLDAGDLSWCSLNSGCQRCDSNSDLCFSSADNISSCYSISPLSASCLHWDLNGDGAITVADASACNSLCACAVVPTVTNVPIPTTVLPTNTPIPTAPPATNTPIPTVPPATNTPIPTLPPACACSLFISPASNMPDPFYPGTSEYWSVSVTGSVSCSVSSVTFSLPNSNTVATLCDSATIGDCPDTSFSYYDVDYPHVSKVTAKAPGNVSISARAVMSDGNFCGSTQNINVDIVPTVAPSPTPTVAVIVNSASGKTCYQMCSALALTCVSAGTDGVNRKLMLGNPVTSTCQEFALGTGFDCSQVATDRGGMLCSYGTETYPADWIKCTCK